MTLILQVGLFLCLILATFPKAEATVQEDLEIVAERLRNRVLGGQSLDLSEVREHIASIQEDGSWSDIDYGDRSRTHWIPREHLRRILNLARSYRESGGALEGATEVRDAFLSGLRYWTERDPQSDNWFRQHIGSPASMGDASILMIDEIPPDLLKATGQLVRRSGFTRTGANLVWEASNLLTWACVTKDPDLLNEVVQQIGGEIRVTTEEGIQPDDSFHQHGPQNYLLGYGRSYATNVSGIAVLLSGTVFAFPEEKIRILSNLILDGQQWFIHGKQIDYHAMGREAFRGRPGRHNWNADVIARACENMRIADPSRADEYVAMGTRLSGDIAAGQSGPVGNKMFWRSDTMVHRGDGWYASVRFYSTRTYLCEVRVNRENLQGYHLSDGVMFLMQRGDEYHDMQPAWDYRKLPGLTVVDTDEPLPYGRDLPQYGNTDFVGGVSDGEFGVAVLDYSKDGVEAKKAYFFTNLSVVCLGAGISSSDSGPLITTLNQCRLRTDVAALREGQVTTVKAEGVEGSDIGAVWHDGVGYVLLEEGSITVDIREQFGAWSLVEEKASSETLSADVFTCTINHGNHVSEASYAYRVVPDVSADDLADLAKDRGVRVLANTSSIQGVYNLQEGVVQAAFYAPGNIDLPGIGRLKVDQPCLVQAHISDDQIELNLADPTQRVAQVGVTIEGYEPREVSGLDVGRTPAQVSFPEGPEAGKTVTVSFVSGGL